MPDENEFDLETGGPDGAPRFVRGRGARRAIGFIVFLVVVVGFAELVAHLPSSTTGASVAIRAVAGVLIGGVIVLVVRRMLRALTEPPPPPPQTVDARYSEVVYVCAICGTRLRLEVAATAKAPRHCGEEMEPQLAHQ